MNDPLDDQRDGGPAFPIFTPDIPVSGSPGISVRDYFAAKAMQAMISNSFVAEKLFEAKLQMTPEGQAAFDTNIMPKTAYRHADAMLKERAALRPDAAGTPQIIPAGDRQATNL